MFDRLEVVMKESMKLLELKGISKEFPGVKALDNVDFDVEAGEVHVLMGENGAGKSTLMKIISGLYQADSGTITMEGEPVHFQNTLSAINHGISMVHQELMPIMEMNVAENIFLGREPVKSGVVNRRALYANTAQLLGQLNINISPKRKMKTLRVAEIQLIEIAKAISFNSKIIIMDEPTSSISERECDNLFEQIYKLKAAGVAIIYISHKMDEIFKIADRITVLRDGKFIGVKPASELNQAELIKMMVGRELTQVFPVSNHTIGDVVLEVEHFSNPGLFNDVSFKLHKGEILGFSGLVGAGRTETMETIFGLRSGGVGVVKKNGQQLRIRNPKDAINAGFALIPEDRKNVGLNLIGGIRTNLSIVSLSNFCSRIGFVKKADERDACSSMAKSLNIKTPSLEQHCIKLSGGNQQKVVIGKWLLNDGDIVIMDEPTRGIDVGAKSEIYNLIHKLAEEGKSVIFISSEMPEIIGISDRVIVMYEGRITGELQREDISQEKIMKLASGLTD